MCDDGQHPSLLNAYEWGNISLETLVIFEKIFAFTVQFDRDIKEKIVWGEIHTKIENYKPFLDVDVKTYKELLRKKVLDWRADSSK